MKEIDKQILALQAKVAEKEAALGKNKRATWHTNCRVLIDGSAVNIQALGTIDECVMAFARLVDDNRSYTEACRLLGVEEKKDFKIGNYALKDWALDFKTQIAKIIERTEKAKLSKMKAKLAELESTDLKTSKALADIAKALE